MIRNLLGYIAILCTLAACTATAATGPKIHVENAWARPAIPMGSMTLPGTTPSASAMDGMSAVSTTEMSGSGTGSAAYFVIVNDGSEADTLVGVTTAAAGQASLHETQINNDIAKMVPIPSLDIPAHGKVEFKPRSYHVMLEGLKQNLEEGETLQLTLLFKKSGSITVDVPVWQQQ
jgi:copper(I)-binding protein